MKKTSSYFFVFYKSMIPIPDHLFTECVCVCVGTSMFCVREQVLSMETHLCVCIFVSPYCLPSSLPGTVFTFVSVVNVSSPL